MRFDESSHPAQLSYPPDNKLLGELTLRHLDESGGAAAFVRNATATGGTIHLHYSGHKSISLSSVPQCVEVILLRRCGVPRRHAAARQAPLGTRIVSAGNKSSRSPIRRKSRQATSWASHLLPLFGFLSVNESPLPLRLRWYHPQR